VTSTEEVRREVGGGEGVGSPRLRKYLRGNWRGGKIGSESRGWGKKENSSKGDVERRACGGKMSSGSERKKEEGPPQGGEYSS